MLIDLSYFATISVADNRLPIYHDCAESVLLRFSIVVDHTIAPKVYENPGARCISARLVAQKENVEDEV